MSVLHKNQTYQLTELPSRERVIGVVEYILSNTSPKVYIKCPKAHKPVEFIILRHFLVAPIFCLNKNMSLIFVSRTGFQSAQPIDIQMHSTLNLMKDKESSSHSCWKNNLSH